VLEKRVGDAMPVFGLRSSIKPLVANCLMKIMIASRAMFSIFLSVSPPWVNKWSQGTFNSPLRRWKVIALLKYGWIR